MFQHIKNLVELDDSGPKAWKLLRDVIQPNTLPMVIVLEKEMAALSMRSGDDVKPVLDKIKDTYVRMAAMCRRCSSAPRSFRCSTTRGTTSSPPPSTLSRSSGHLSGHGSRFCRRTSAGATRVVMLPTKLLRGMELQEAVEEEGEGEAEAVGEALAEGEAEVTIMRGMGALCFDRPEGWAPPGMKPPSGERARGGAVQGSGAQGDGAYGKADSGMFLMVEDVKGSEGDVGFVGKVVMHALTHWVIDSERRSRVRIPVFALRASQCGGVSEVYPLKTKGEVAAAVLKEWMLRAQRESGHKVKVIRTDNGGEFISADFETVLKKKGIQHQLMVPYNPQQNGTAERFNRTLQEGVRTLLGRAGLPDPFWVTTLRQVALVKNRLLATVGDKQWVPYTKWYGSAPAVNMLRAYGCMVVFHVPEEKRGKLEASGRWGVHLGLAKDHKGWLIWDLTSQQLTVSRDVKFLESLYYKEWKQQQEASSYTADH
ncbi:unnamed protein product [Closterium sp. NIES-53]